MYISIFVCNISSARIHVCYELAIAINKKLIQ